MFYRGVQTATFMNEDLDLVVGHQNLLSMVLAKVYLPRGKPS